MKLSPIGIWTSLDGSLTPTGGPAIAQMSASQAAQFATKIESLGYSALWIPEGFGRNPLVLAGWLLANTTTLIVATGIANLYARDATAMATAQRTLDEQSGGRFLLGIGVSHAKIVQNVRGHDYGKPLSTMRTYLTAMAQAPYTALQPPTKPVTVIAALRDKMLALSAEMADGAHPLNVTPQHTAQARKILGPDKLLCVEQKLVLETDPTRARAIGRATLAIYLTLENYRNLWLSLGFSEADIAGEGSDHLIDALIGWGDEAALRTRIQQHLDAGATHVCINPVSPDNGIDMRIVEMLAPG